MEWEYTYLFQILIQFPVFLLILACSCCRMVRCFGSVESLKLFLDDLVMPFGNQCAQQHGICLLLAFRYGWQQLAPLLFQLHFISPASHINIIHLNTCTYSQTFSRENQGSSRPRPNYTRSIKATTKKLTLLCLMFPASFQTPSTLFKLLTSEGTTKN